MHEVEHRAASSKVGSHISSKTEGPLPAISMPLDAGWFESSTGVSDRLDLFELADIGLVIVGPDGRVRRANSAFRRIVGRSPDEITDATFFSLTHPDDVHGNEALMQRLITEKVVETVWIEKRYLRSDGTVVWVELAIHPLVDDGGALTCFLTQVVDISARKRAEGAAQLELHELEEAQRIAHLGSFEQDPGNGMIEISSELGRLLEIESTGPMSAARVMEVVHPDDRNRLAAAIEACLTEHLPVDMVHRLLLADGTTRWVQAQGEWVKATEDGHDLVVGTVLDITDRQVAATALAYEGTHDKLTGLRNRVAFLEQVDRACNDSRQQAKQLAVLLLDVDDFKTVNDSLGHAVGDELLVDLSHRLVAATRAGDILARFGGDEFAVLVGPVDARHVAEELARRIIEALREPFILAGNMVELSASVGIALSDPVGDSGALLRDADLAMYLAKQNGKGQYEIAESGMQERALERLVGLGDLHHGVEHDEFEVYYQPIVDTQSSALAGAEALVRWNHPKRGLVSPSSFIELAESSGLIVPIGRGVRHEACQQLAVWRAAGIVDDDFYVSVNLSPRQLGEETLVDNVSRDLDDAGLPARALVLEITESCLMADFDTGLSRLRELKAIGLRLALDDYGTGYSSLSRLSELPIDILKIDKSFIDAVAVDAKGKAIVQSVVDAAAALGMSTVAEGVEDQVQREVLDVIGCGYIQGFLFSKPLAPVDVEPVLRTLQLPYANNPATRDEHWGPLAPVASHPASSSATSTNVRSLQQRTSPHEEQPSADDQQAQLLGDGQTRTRAVDRSFQVMVRTLLSAPSLCINIFWAAALVSVSILAVSKHWSWEQLLPQLIVIGTCICGFVARISIGSRLPRWTLHIDLLIAQLICVTLVAVGDTSKLDFSAFFVWVVLYAAMYLRPVVALGYFVAACSEYALVLFFGPRISNPLTSWLMLFASTAITTIVVFGVVSVLRSSGHEDPLTGLPNRRSFDERLNEELERSRRSFAPVSVAMIDLDGFKAVNDQFGHEAGDDLLRELARGWLLVLRDGGDFLARIGGDEFVVIAPNSDELGIRRVAERLSNSLPDRVHCSIGTASWNRSESPSDLIHRADQKMYERKLRHRRGERLRHG